MHELLQNNLLARALDFEPWRKRSGEFHDAVIEERRPHFNGVRHTHAVDLHQDVVRKVVFLIEPKVRRQIVSGLRQFIENAVERAGARTDQ